MRSLQCGSKLKSKFNPMTTAHRLKVIYDVVWEEPVASPGLLELWLGSRDGSSLVWRGRSLWRRSQWHSSRSDGSRPLRQPDMIKDILLGRRSLYHPQHVDTFNEEAGVTSFSEALMTAERRRQKGSSLLDGGSPPAPVKQAWHSR